MTQEALKLTLEFVESINLGSRSASVEQQRQVITALRKALTQPEQEPVAWMTQARNFIHLSASTEAEAKLYGWKAVYTHLQRKWVGLTDEEMEATFIQCGGKWNGDFWKIEDADFHPFLRTIEAILKQKNGYAEEKNT